MKITIHQARDFEPQKATCAECGQGIHQVSEFCPCCGEVLWAHDTLLSAWVCAGGRASGREFATHVRPDNVACLRCGRLAGMPSAPCPACPDAGGAEYITITPSPEMRAAVLAAAGLPDLALAEHTAPTPCTCEYQSHFNGFGHGYQQRDAGARSTKETGPICDECADTHYAEFVTALAEHTHSVGDRVRNRHTGATGTVTKVSADFVTVEQDAGGTFSGWHSAFEPAAPDVSMALAEHTAPALEAIEQAARQDGADAAIDVMIAALDAAPDLSDGIDPRTWREVYDAHLVSTADVNRAYGYLASGGVVTAPDLGTAPNDWDHPYFRPPNSVPADPFAGIPNADDSDNEPL